LNCI
jgi:hypothetical protein